MKGGGLAFQGSTMANRNPCKPETKAKIAKAMTGRKCPEAVKAKIRATLRRKWDLVKQIEAANAA